MESNLDNAIRDASLLLEFAAHRGVEVKSETVKALVDTRALVGTAGVSAQIEADFWKALADLSALVRPTTVASLLAVRYAPNGDGENGQANGNLLARLFHRERSKADDAVRRYRLIAAITLVLLVVTQVYWLIGSTALNDVRTIPGEQERISDEIAKRKRQLGDKAAEDTEIPKLEMQYDRLEQRLATSYDVLGQWNGTWNPMTWNLRWVSRHVPWLAQTRIASDYSADVRERVLDANHPTENKTTVADVFRQRQRQRFIFEAQAEFALKALQLFVLPAFYGLLGTCVFILRALAIEIREVSYESDVAYRLRWPLGALAGIAVAWFINPETAAPIFKSVPPLALAFLAGYSVELLFSAMDRFIAAFSKDSRMA